MRWRDPRRVLERSTTEAFFRWPEHPRAQQFLSDIRTPFAQAA
jgi:polar amino acid transport system ATP-binding protein